LYRFRKSTADDCIWVGAGLRRYCVGGTMPLALAPAVVSDYGRLLLGCGSMGALQKRTISRLRVSVELLLSVIIFVCSPSSRP
jgi:hypothetical protein